MHQHRVFRGLPARFSAAPWSVVGPVVVLLTLLAAAKPGRAAELPQPLSQEEIANGWIALFDGQTLYGWRAESKADWRVEDGAIKATSGEAGLLRTTTQFSDYLLRLEFRCAAGVNSGVFLRTRPRVGRGDVEKYCYELNIAPPENPFPTGSFVGRQRVEGAGEKPGVWRSYEVRLEGADVTVRLDGEEILQYQDPLPLGRGFIGLQFRQGGIAFRNIKLKPLGGASIFNGKDLAGWKEYPEMASKFSVTPSGEMQVVNGRGQLETNEKYADFVLQLECNCQGDQLNSGVFFRCIPGDVMMGYECQIQNGYKNGDRTQPVDCGTGGIFRRKNARFVAADDHAWFSMTLIAEGPHIASWVNGVQVCDWTDQRKPHENPRKGLRLEAGTIMLQGHDPTTDILFRNFSIDEMTARFPR